MKKEALKGICDGNMEGIERDVEAVRREELHGRVCSYCSVPLGQTRHVKCAVCVDVRLCTACFSVSASLLPHVSSHPYFAVENVASPLFAEGWSATEEELLLDGLLKYGMGNWEAVAEYVQTKTETECELHYQLIYLDSAQYPFAVDEIIPAPEVVTSAEGEEKGATPPILKQAGLDEERTMTPAMVKKASHGNRRVRKGSAHHEVSGYYPNRGDFDVEWDDGAESILADLTIEHDDMEEEIDLKVRLMQICVERLDERDHVKEFVFKRRLLDFETLRSRERKVSKEERELMSTVQAFARLHSEEKQTALESALLYEQRLINRIYELSHYRSQGLRTFKEADMYELDRKKRLSEIQLRAAKEPAYRSGLKATNRGSRYVNRDRPVGSPVVSSTSSNTRLQAAWSPEGFTSSEMLSSSSKEKESSAGKIVKATRSKDFQPPLDVSSMPGFESLYPKERELCSMLRISPEHFTATRNAGLEESRQLGYGDGVSTFHRIVLDLSRAEEDNPCAMEGFTVQRNSDGERCFVCD